MTLFELVEHLSDEEKIAVIHYGNIEYRGTVGEITVEKLRNREVIKESVVFMNGEINIHVQNSE